MEVRQQTGEGHPCSPFSLPFSRASSLPQYSCAARRFCSPTTAPLLPRRSLPSPMHTVVPDRLKVAVARDQNGGGVEEKRSGVEERQARGQEADGALPIHFSHAGALPICHGGWIYGEEEEGRQQGEEHAARYGEHRPAGWLLSCSSYHASSSLDPWSW